MDLSLKGVKPAFITGAASGIGWEIAKKFAEGKVLILLSQIYMRKKVNMPQ